MNQDPSYYIPGGTRAEVSLHEPLCQIMAQCHNIAHPRSRSLVSIANGVFGVVKHLDQDIFKLGNQWYVFFSSFSFHFSPSGLMASKKSSLKVLDKCVKGPNKVDFG